MKINLDEIGFKIKFVDDEKTKAMVTLDFGDFVIKGFRVQLSQYENEIGDKLWFTPPCYKGPGRYHPMFYMPDKDQWNKLENRFWKEFYSKRNERDTRDP